MFLLISEIVTILLLVLFFWVQLIWPAANGRKLFPMFRQESEFEKELNEINQALYEKELKIRNIDLRGKLQETVDTAKTPTTEVVNSSEVTTKE